jgi:dCMP deaminase
MSNTSFRIGKNVWALALAVVTSLRGTCLRRKVGCVLLDNQGQVMSTGYNGVPSGMPHCGEQGCTCSAAKSASGTNLDGCQAVHAEQNALLQCRDVGSIRSAYVTCSPCMTCTKLLMNTGCQEIFFLEEYPASGAKELWLQSGRRWTKLEEKSLRELTGLAAQ